MRVAAHLDIPFITVDLEKEYKRGVADYMIAEYKAGRTPNPDVMCNKEIKFGAFLKHALKLGADAMATGHYAQVIPPSPSLNLREGRGEIQLLCGIDPTKDQSYFLWTLNQAQLSKTIFPVGHLLKSEVRQLAKEFKLPVAEKRDSQGICFLGNVDMKDFLAHYVKSKPGNVLDLRGRVLGRHDGAIFYTLGQVWPHSVETSRGEHTRLYVVTKDIEQNIIIVSPDATRSNNERSPANAPIRLRDVNWISGAVPEFPLKCEARIRYRQPVQGCRIMNNESRIMGKEFNSNSIIHNSCFIIQFDEPQRAITPGQSIVFYQGNEMLGGGVIDEGIRGRLSHSLHSLWYDGES